MAVKSMKQIAQEIDNDPTRSLPSRLPAKAVVMGADVVDDVKAGAPEVVPALKERGKQIGNKLKGALDAGNKFFKGLGNDLNFTKPVEPVKEDSK